MSYIIDFLEGLVDAIMSIAAYFFLFIDKLLDFIFSLFTLLPQMVSEAGDSLKLVYIMFSALPDKIWFYIFCCLSITALTFVIWNTRD